MIQTAGFLWLLGDSPARAVRPVNVSNGFNNPHKNSPLSLSSAPTKTVPAASPSPYSYKGYKVTVPVSLQERSDKLALF